MIPLALSVMLAMPTGGFAQGELSKCSPYGQESLFPCRTNQGVARSAAELRALTQPAARARNVARCRGTDQQESFPCKLALGGFATSRAALREVRQRVDEQRKRAAETDRTLSQRQILEIIAGSPGIVPQLTPVPAAEAAPKPKPIPNHG